ncbi:expressed unknown protein [Seminavis robusta]|uniref:Uncharacterized protein n=1 Tax=Seminavis robusta TaxID=568900 RepID=A0A9N8DW29_9STRA|nr:expressed unknown protein [Seminavis robusta]|eukprot:Sro400_g135220.1 n/a (255) ;mRNA; r:63154-63918
MATVASTNNEHLWKLYRSHTIPYPNHEDYNDDDAFDEARDVYFAAEEERQEGIPHNQPLSSVSGFNAPGNKLNAEYDFGSTTRFDVSFVALEEVPLTTEVPCLAAVPMDEDFIAYTPPAGTGSVNLNDKFPFANKACFQTMGKWICPFPTSYSSAGFVEGGIKCNSDIIFMPFKFSSLNEALVGMDLAMKKYPQKGYSRLVFPVKLRKKDEKFFQDGFQASNEYLEFHSNPEAYDMSALSENIRGMQTRKLMFE